MGDQNWIENMGFNKLHRKVKIAFFLSYSVLWFTRVVCGCLVWGWKMLSQPIKKRNRIRKGLVLYDVLNLPNTIAPWRMDRERIVVHQLDDIESGIVVRCFEVVQISDNCSSPGCNHASYALSRAVAETIEPEMNGNQNKNTNTPPNQLFTHNFQWILFKRKVWMKMFEHFTDMYCGSVATSNEKNLCAMKNSYMIKAEN